VSLTTAPLSAELGNKSSSAPLLVKKAISPGSGGGKPEDVKRRVSAPLLAFSCVTAMYQVLGLFDIRFDGCDRNE
jgi:hypothetical protein